MASFSPNDSHRIPVRRPLLRRSYLLALIPAVILAGRIAKSDVVRVPADDGGEWSITIAPASKTATAPAAALPAPAHLPVQQVALTETQTVQAEAAPATPAEGAARAPATLAPQPPQAPAETTAEGIVIAPNHSGVPQVSAYSKIYNAIPFNRTEYLANPSYRQDMAMELLTGNQRQIVYHRNYTPQLNLPTKGHPLFLYNRYGGYYGGGMGYAPGAYGFPWGFNNAFGYPPAFRYFMPLEDLY